MEVVVFNMKTVFLIVGESSSGKDSLVARLCNETGLRQLVSYATRPRRENEGNIHIFISDDEVGKHKDDMIAYTKIGPFQYFSTIQQLYDSDIYVIDPKGTEYMKCITKYKNITDIRFVTIYINTPSILRKERALSQRHDDPNAYYNRVLDEQEQFINFRAAAEFDYAILNIDFNKSYKILKHIIQTELEVNHND